MMKSNNQDLFFTIPELQIAIYANLYQKSEKAMKKETTNERTNERLVVDDEVGPCRPNYRTRATAQ
jgi:hypothetical protein